VTLTTGLDGAIVLVALGHATVRTMRELPVLIPET